MSARGTAPAIFLTFLMMAWSQSFALTSNPEEEAEGRARWSEKLNKATELPVEERIPLLQSAIFQLSKPSVYADREKAEPLLRQARDLMLAIPGYADYYRDKLAAGNAAALENGPAWNSYMTEVGHAMSTLRQLPAPETVRALAELLDYDKNRNVPYERGSLSTSAAGALFELLETPPTRSAMSRWLEWRERVRSGKETFQLKGSEVRYNFDGPVGLPKDPVAPVSSTSAPLPPPGSLASSNAGKLEQATVTKGIAFALLAGLGALVVLMWKLNSKKRTSGK